MTAATEQHAVTCADCGFLFADNEVFWSVRRNGSAIVCGTCASLDEQVAQIGSIDSIEDLTKISDECLEKR